jgi:hypothetical protein
VSARIAVYRSLYLFLFHGDAVKFVSALADGVVSSFGCDDDQWEGLDATDPGATITLHTRTADHGSKARHGLVSVECRVPIEHLPAGYWFSPAIDENLMTVDEAGNSTHGEPVRWGLLPQREVKS